MFDCGEGNDFKLSGDPKNRAQFEESQYYCADFPRFDRFERVCFVIRASLMFRHLFVEELLQRSSVLFEIKIKQRLFELTLYTSVL